MTLQVLVAAMHQNDHALLDKMHIDSDVCVGNQCGIDLMESFDYHGFHAAYYASTLRGVGCNRNLTLLHADADIVLFADADVVYEKGYRETVLHAYESHPEADVIIFNVKKARDPAQQLTDTVTKNRYVHRTSLGRYGMYGVSARVDSLHKKNIMFHQMFGGGAKYASGEDTIFLQDCIKRGLRIYTCKDTIGTVLHDASTWFEGYNEKYFHDKGVLFAYLYPYISYFLSIYHVWKHRKRYHTYGVFAAVHSMLRGCKERL